MATQLTLELFDDIESRRQETIAVCVRPAKQPEYKSLKARHLSLAELPGVFPADFGFRIVEDLEIGTDSFNPKHIPFEIRGDPNEELWRAVKEGKIDREKIFSEYKSLGQTVAIEGDRGIPDLAKKRALTLQQFFTPPIIARCQSA